MDESPLINDQRNNLLLDLLNPTALNFLLQKLKIGNLRVSNLNCLPGRSSNRLGLQNFDELMTSYSSEFLNSLLTSSNFTLKLTITDKLPENILEDSEEAKSFKKLQGITRRRLNNITYDLKNEFQEYGTKSLGFGYPIVLLRDPNDQKKLIAAPLIIWYLDLVKDGTNAHTWKLTKGENNPIIFNDIFFNYLKEAFGLNFDDFKSQQESILEDGKIDESELNKLIEMFMKKMNESNHLKVSLSENIPLQTLNDKEQANELLDKNKVKIINNGVFSFYRTYKQNIINDLSSLIKQLSDLDFSPIEENYSNDFFSAVNTDPSQSILLESIGSERNVLVQGPPGTGKSQSITAIVTNALKNEAKCLIVCEKKTAMDVIYNNLHKLGLGDFAVVIDDPIMDRHKVVKSIRDKYENMSMYMKSFNRTNIDSQNQKYKELVDILKNHHREKNIPVINKNNRKDLISRMLEDISDEHNPLEEVSIENFKLDSDEYNQLKSTINELISNAKFLRNNSTILLLSKHILDHEYKESRNKVSTDIQDLINISTLLNSQYVKDEFLNQVAQLCTKDINNIKNILLGIKSEFDTLGQKIQTQLLKTTPEVTQTEKLLSIISTDKKRLIAFKESFGSKLNQVKEISSKNPFIFLNIPQSSSNALFSKIINDLNKDIEYTSDEKLITHIYAKEELDFRLTKENFFKSSNWEKLLININKYNEILKNSYINDFEKLPINISEPIENIVEKVQENEKLLKQLSTTLDYFHDYYYLLKFISEKDLQTVSILEVLIKNPTFDWLSIFERWYIQTILKNKPAKGILKTDNQILELLNIRKEVKQIYSEIINNYWSRKSYESFTANRGGIQFKSLYNLKGKTGERRNSLKTILDFDFANFTNIYPVILTNPNTASTILPMRPGIFDVVIFDEASQLKIEDTITSLIRGSHRVISGDKHQMPPSSYFIGEVDIDDESEDNNNEKSPDYDPALESAKKILKNQLINLVTSESLLEFAEQANFKEVYLDIHYRSRHPDLIEFSNKAFYNSRLLPVPQKDEYIPINFWQENGTYNSEDNTNHKEAEKIIELIKAEYKSNPENTIGVATLNLKQRNYVLDMITNTGLEDKDFAEMMNHLETKGFFVKNLENIQGDERDVIIISTTFGKTEEGDFIQNFGPLNRKGGYRLLNVIVTRAKKKLHLITSIPESSYMSFSELIPKQGNDGKAIFYAYIAYAKSISEGVKELKDKVLRIVANKNIYDKENNDLELTESPFEEEIYQKIVKFVPADKVHLQEKLGGFRIDMTIDTKVPGKKIAIECDGATYHGSEEDYQWDMFRQEYLEQFGYVFHRIWSENWWEDASSEMRKLVQFVESNDGYIRVIN